MKAPTPDQLKPVFKVPSPGRVVAIRKAMEAHAAAAHRAEEAGEQPALEAAELRGLVSELCRAHPVEYMQRMGRRIDACDDWSIVLTRWGDDGRMTNAQPYYVGCKSRACTTCNARRRGSLDRKYRPYLAALAAAGCGLIFSTLTVRSPYLDGVHRIHDRRRWRLDDGMDAVGTVFAAFRDGRPAREAWGKRFCGGFYGREATLYNPKTGRRRPHVHLHAVLVTPPGVDTDNAGEWLKARWCELAAEHGLRALPQAQDVQTITAEDLEDVSTYCVKYISKATDLRTPGDCADLLMGCKGVRQVQTLGLLHAASLPPDPAKDTPLRGVVRAVRNGQLEERDRWISLQRGIAERQALQLAEAQEGGALYNFYRAVHAVHPLDADTAPMRERAELDMERAPLPLRVVRQLAQLGDGRAVEVMGLVTQWEEAAQLRAAERAAERAARRKRHEPRNTDPGGGRAAAHGPPV